MHNISASPNSGQVIGDVEDQRRSTHVAKWAIFGVVLPLLPIVARVLAALLTGESSTPSFDELFGDGELLVVSTVIAAAGIGDLVFDGERVGWSVRDSVATVGGLIIVIAAVLLYGLASSQSENRSLAQEEFNYKSTFVQRTVKTQSAALMQRDNELKQRIGALTQEIATGDTKTKSLLTPELTATQHDQNEVENEYYILNPPPADAADVQRDTLTIPELARGRHEAAVASVTIFPFAIIAGFLCIQSRRARGGPSEEQLTSDSEDAEDEWMPEAR